VGSYARGYVYDTLGQLTRVNDQKAGQTWTYEYDLGGNILEKKRYAYTTGTLGPVLESIPYAYDTVWKDKLASYDGKAITYDAIGNPWTYDGYTFYWKAGRMLHKLAGGGMNAEFTYDHTGLRVKKTVNDIDTLYTWNGTKMTHIRKGDTQMHFFYDSQRWPSLVRYNGVDYAYFHNLQGDILGLSLTCPVKADTLTACRRLCYPFAAVRTLRALGTPVHWQARRIESFIY